MSGTQNPPVPQNKGLDPSPDRPRKTTSPANASVNMDELTELAVHPRPFVKEFLTYLLENFYVLIWSSAQKHNVDRMIGRLLGEHQRHLVGRWHRDYCDLVRPKSHGGNTNQAFLTSREAAAARYKPLALKDLDKIWKTHKLRTAQAPPSTLRRNGTHRHQPQPIWMMEDALLEAIDARTHQILRWHRGNTLIVDDSADKVRYHGSNHIAIEDFEANPNPYDNDLEALLSYVKKLHASEHAKAGADIAQFDITDYLQRNPWTEFRAGVPRRVNRG
ncbi:hypothetical protein IWQ60_008069 [Tieghemiomyces parasiticus]|uniref:Mitochondrial import inner membrane translocase subunit TIM50 n=1 Tax=Tieghemiomyces parasiticus TaxID=78921 RepID=A0A9W7ZTX9_9FUNG|nr:hypothetical protein IWQ60_008069 [Tieghemiomyces parasiticus]